MLDYLEKQDHQSNHPSNLLQQFQMTNRGPTARTSASQQQLLQLQGHYPPISQASSLTQSIQQSQPQATLGGQNLLIDVQANQLQLQQQQPANNELIGYYFGSISRETAEWILKNHGNGTDGAYLLRSSGPNDNFVLSLMVVHGVGPQALQTQTPTQQSVPSQNLEVLHYKIVETEDSFVALHGQVGDEKFATIDELIDKAQGVATKPRWPIQRLSLESQILPPTYWGLTVDQVRLAILIKAKQWGFPLSSIFQQQQQQHQNASQIDQAAYNSGTLVGSNCGSTTTIDGHNAQPANANSTNTMDSTNGMNSNVTPLNNETIRTLIYKSLHEFQPWFHGKISRDEAERRIEEGQPRDGRFLVRERDNFSYAMCISHKRTTKHYRIDVIPTGELAIQDGRKFTSLMALVSHYTIMSDGLWCALTEACPRPIQADSTNLNRQLPMSNRHVLGSIPQNNQFRPANGLGVIDQSSNGLINQANNNNNLYCVPPRVAAIANSSSQIGPPLSSLLPAPNGEFMTMTKQQTTVNGALGNQQKNDNASNHGKQLLGLVCPNQNGTVQLKAPIKEWLHNINSKWSQLMSAKSQHQSLNSFLFGSSNPLNNHCRHSRRGHQHHHNHHHHHHHSNHQHNHDHHQRRKCKNAQNSCNVCSHHQLVAANSHRSNGIHNDGKLLGKHKEDIAQQQHQHRNNSCSCCNTSIKARTALLPAVDQPQQLNSLAADQSWSNISQLANGNVFASTAIMQNSTNSGGFSLNGNSFIGSPLFAVKPAPLQTGPDTTTLLGRGRAGSGGGSGSGNSGNNENVNREEKLISPAQSVASNLNNNNNNNNPYNLGSDIYRSPASTAIVNDHQMIPTSSSSSSGNHQLTQLAGQQQQQQQFNPTMKQLQRCSQPIGHPCNPNYPINKFQASAQQQQQQQQQPIQHAGPILCGQHAGPAFRYTNCNANDSFGPCTHHQSSLGRPSGGGGGSMLRAADDSLLMSPSTQLAGPAALAKFVQFQDGQCLRTHRDTKSIQMAYLSSIRQSIPNNNNNNTGKQRNNNQVPNNNSYHANTLGKNYIARNNTGTIAGVGSTATLNNQHWHASNQQGQISNNDANKRATMMLRNDNNNIVGQPDIDLIDCDGEGFEFKYNPKMIKSSSIETLCGAGEAEPVEETLDSLDKYKNNQELIMSLQSYWMNTQDNNNNNNQANDILHPIPVYGGNEMQKQDQKQVEDSNISGCCNALDCQLQGCGNNLYGEQQQEQQQQTLLSSFMEPVNGIGVNAKGEQYDDYMRKNHGLDELTTSLLAKLTEDLKAQVDLKNKRSGLGSTLQDTTTTFNNNKQTNQKQQQQQSQFATEYQTSRGDQDHVQAVTRSMQQQQQLQTHTIEMNPRELINEFDTLVRSQRQPERE